ncbi:hypothetical protein protein [Bacillus cereus G9241]|nr:hypothetical protein protein [Bacillus cereus G9241]
MASVILLFPLPLGPTTDVTPGTKSTDTRSAKDLNPAISNLFKNTKGLPPILRCYKCYLYKNNIYTDFLSFYSQMKGKFHSMHKESPSFKGGFLIVVLLTFSTLLQQLVAPLLFSTCHYQVLKPRYLT